MSWEIMKDVLALKFKIMDAITDKMPEIVRDDMKKLQHDVLTTVNKITQEYLERKTEKQEEPAIKSVPIE